MTRDLLLWNADTVNHHANTGLRELLKLHDPEAAVITEAYHIDGALPGYRVLHAPAHTARQMVHGAVDESRDVLLAIRDDIKVVRHQTRLMTVPWEGPNGRQHSAKVAHAVTLKDDEGTWRLSGEHWPTGHAGKNRQACNEQRTQAGIWLKSGMPGRPSVIAGDLNVNGADLAEWLHQQGATSDGHNVDRAICRGCRVARVQPLDSYGSNHQAVLLHLAGEAKH